MRKSDKTVKEIIQFVLDNPDGLDGKKMAKISNKKFFENFNK